jgi:transcriptional regulator with XRE-family HTH domain
VQHYQQGVNMRRALTQDELEDAARLRKLYDRKAGEMGTSQAQIAEEFGFANPSAVSQYLCGRIPLNLNAATKFANFFNVPLKTISPRHAETVGIPTDQGSILAELGVTPDCEAIPATDQARKLLGNFDHLVVDRTLKSLSAGTFLVGGGDDARVIIVSMEGDTFCVKGLGDEGSEVRLPPAAAPLINVDGRVVLMTRKF